MGRLMKKIKNKQYGQAMAEFALTIPVFLLLVFGIIEFSRFFLTYSSVFTASREASRYGASVGESTETNDLQNYENCKEIANRAVAAGWFGGVSEFNEDPDSNEEINIFYESSPGNVVGVCDKKFVDGVFTGEYELSYEPSMGDRVVVEVTTTYRSILGIVPDIPVHSQNGRTIMMGISIEKEPPIIDICDEHVKILGEPNQDGENILYIEVENTSLTTQYLIYKIKNIQWEFLNEDEEEPKLEEIRWIDDDRPIWIKPDDPNIPNDEEPGALPVLTIPEGNIVEYWKEFTRNLPPNTASEKLEFIFDGPVSNEGEEINLTFQLIMQHGSIPSDLCNPVLIKE